MMIPMTRQAFALTFVGNATRIYHISTRRDGTTPLAFLLRELMSDGNAYMEHANTSGGQRHWTPVVVFAKNLIDIRPMGKSEEFEVPDPDYGGEIGLSAEELDDVSYTAGGGPF